MFSSTLRAFFWTIQSLLTQYVLFYEYLNIEYGEKGKHNLNLGSNIKLDKLEK